MAAADAGRRRLDLPVVDLASPDLRAAAKSIRQVDIASPNSETSSSSPSSSSKFLSLLASSTDQRSTQSVRVGRRAWSTASSTWSTTGSTAPCWIGCSPRAGSSSSSPRRRRWRCGRTAATGATPRLTPRRSTTTLTPEVLATYARTCSQQC